MKFLFPLLALLPLLTASAQTDASSVSTFRITAIGGVYDDLFYDLKGAKTSVFASMSGLSVPYVCPSGSQLSLYRESPPPAGSPPDTEPTKKVVAEVSLPADCKRSIVLLAPAPAASPLPMVSIAIPELPEEQTIGTFQVFNLSPYPAAFGLEGKVVPLSPQASAVVPFAPGATDIKVVVRMGNTWHSIYESERRLAVNLRGYCIVINSKPGDPSALPAQTLMLLDYVRTPRRK